jgi:hypothetical protein
MIKRNALLSIACFMLAASLILSNGFESGPVVDFLVGFLQGGAIAFSGFNFFCCRKGEEDPCEMKKRLLNQKA